MNKPNLSGLKRSGFTLLELIVVITIIGILASLVVVRTTGFGPRARRTKVESDLQTIIKVAEAIYVETGRYPQTIEEMINPTDANGMPLSASLEKYPKDPWQGEYVYEILDGSPRVTCMGADGELGGEGENEDISKPDTTESL